MRHELVDGDDRAGRISGSIDATASAWPGLSIADTAAPLLDWKTSSASLAIWRRELPPDIDEALAKLPVDEMTDWRLDLNVEAMSPAIVKALSDCGIEDDNLRGYLAADMTLLTRVFARGTGKRKLEARLDIVRNDACRRFHKDNYPERLAVTYLGSGTVAVPRCHGQKALAEQEKYAGPAIKVPPFWASLFAGEKAGREGIVHRSPRISGTGKTRLFFCVNASPN
ncbi:MAG: DUF1826 domain-containing protein [Filomicrobium sp.]